MLTLFGLDSDTAAQIKALLPQATITYADWLNRVQHGFKGKPYDPSKTVWQKVVDLLDGVPATPPTGWSVAPPKAPIHSATNGNGVGLELEGGPSGNSDYLSTGTFDSGVLLGPECAGSNFARFHLDQAASVGNGPGWGRHALYCKAANVSCYDWYARCDPKAKDIGSIFSIRFAGFHAERFDVAGLWFASLFDDDPQHKSGTAVFRNGKAQFASSAAILYDSQIVFDITIDNVAFTGPNDILIHVDGGSKTPSSVKVMNCTMNGKKITASMFQGVPSSALAIS